MSTRAPAALDFGAVFFQALALIPDATMGSKRNDHHAARRLARRAFYRQHGLCFWCKRTMVLLHKAGAGDVDPLLMTAEHVLPVWAGGLTRPGNVVAACFECNNARSCETNQTRRGTKFTIGNDTPTSPFEILRRQLEAEAKQDERRRQVKWLLRSGEL